MSSLADEAAEGARSSSRRFVPPVWLLTGVVVLLVTAGFYFILWRPLQVQTAIVRRMESMGASVGMEIGYREVGPNWLRQLTGHHPHAWSKLPKVGGIFDQVIYVSAHSGVPFFVQVGFQTVHDIPHRLLVDLQQFPSLKDLYLQNTNLTDDSLSLIAELKALRELNLANTDIRGDALWHLQKLPFLDRLTLHGCAIDDDCLADLATLQSLRSLDLGETDICGRELWQLQKLPHLESLDLGRCPVRGEYLGDLAGCLSLKSLDMDDCPHLTPDAFGALRAARPDLEIYVDHSPTWDL
jgi:hypothetical protein